jgi:RNA polymerase sigma-70 factor (ECF subfamily)
MAGDDDAEDLASVTWLEIVRGLEAFEGDEDQFRARLFTTARHRFLDARRNAGRRPVTVELGARGETVDVAADPQVLVTDAAGTEAALAAIAALPPDQAEVVLLRVVADLDVATVARIVDKRPGTVRVLAHRGLQRLMTKVCVVEGAGGVTR